MISLISSNDLFLLLTQIIPTIAPLKISTLLLVNFLTYNLPTMNPNFTLPNNFSNYKYWNVAKNSLDIQYYIFGKDSIKVFKIDVVYE